MLKHNIINIIIALQFLVFAFNVLPIILYKYKFI